jgi:hypothetical protein
MRQLQKRKYQRPQLQKHDTLKDLTLQVTWQFNGPCPHPQAENNPDGECSAGFDCE